MLDGEEAYEFVSMFTTRGRVASTGQSRITYVVVTSAITAEMATLLYRLLTEEQRCFFPLSSKLCIIVSCIIVCHAYLCVCVCLCVFVLGTLIVHSCTYNPIKNT